jgi:hypothetical protein
VITLGSPFRSVEPSSGAAVPLRDTPTDPDHRAQVRREVGRDPSGALPVPSTAIYTRTDGVVPWQACVEAEGPRRQNVEVYASHIGLGHNPTVLLVVADRLAQPEGQWAPFSPPRLLAGLYPGTRAAA